jgi:hypothetical protein
MTNENVREVKYIEVGISERGNKIIEIHRTPRHALRLATLCYEQLQKNLCQHGLKIGHLEAHYRAVTVALAEAKTAYIGNLQWKPSGARYAGLLTLAWDEYALVGTTVQDILVEDVSTLYDAAQNYGEASLCITLGVSLNNDEEEESLREIYQTLLEQSVSE